MIGESGLYRCLCLGFCRRVGGLGFEVEIFGVFSGYREVSVVG